MIGTLINVLTILVGGSIGLVFSSRIPKRINHIVIAGLGLFTVAIGIQMFLKTQNSFIVLGAILIGGILGEWWRIETHLNNLGENLEKLLSKKERYISPDDNNGGSRFIKGFLTSSLLYCIGPMAILGAIQDGLTGDYSLLAVKSVLDGFASIAFTATLGVGVFFSALMVLIFQGGISLLADQAQAVISEPMMNEMTAVGGLLLIGLAISSLLDIKSIQVGNFLPALMIAPLIVVILTLFGIG